MNARVYDTRDWLVAREQALARDGHRCTVARLLGGECKGTLHVHHVQAVEAGGEAYALDNLATVCASHHPRWESVRRSVVRAQKRQWRRCAHAHRSAEARAICERRLNRELVSA